MYNNIYTIIVFLNVHRPKSSMFYLQTKIFFLLHCYWLLIVDCRRRSLVHNSPNLFWSSHNGTEPMSFWCLLTQTMCLKYNILSITITIFKHFYIYLCAKFKQYENLVKVIWMCWIVRLLDFSRFNYKKKK